MVRELWQGEARCGSGLAGRLHRVHWTFAQELFTGAPATFVAGHPEQSVSDAELTENYRAAR
jgi:hypothetical protein